MGKDMRTKTSLLRFPRSPLSIVGVLFLALGLFLCTGFPAQAHVAHDAAARFFRDLGGELRPDVPFGKERVQESPEAGPQTDRFDAVEGTRPDTLVDALHDWRRLDAALARPETASAPGISETLSGPGRPSVRPSRGLSAKLSHAGPHAALLPSSPVPPLRAAEPVAVPLGTPPCFLPAARGLVFFSLPPPHFC